ncbi:TetR/AcrR family transcriptional regulator [Pseudonocardia sp. TRM90224]|uniref:TetR/AcrR family transcriptional regulator n=1 Tax=Pseudonocardia sp. TRM90224 TaxID=2812678 RepID=UPI001E5BF086|nr:TetR/AcrR family transcriptional regulator [Pseudonocardia sp. TRM90224]
MTEKRAELAIAALQTLAELGFARATLREIAQNSPYSHGLVHYYFADKADLITECVKQYKAICVRRYDGLVTDAGTPAELRTSFARGLAASLVDDSSMHRLWYDLRSQCMFEQGFRDEVAAIDKSLEKMIWRIVRRYAELCGQSPAVGSAFAYSLFDGLFQHALIRHLDGQSNAASTLRRQTRTALDQLVPVAASNSSAVAS